MMFVVGVELQMIDDGMSGNPGQWNMLILKFLPYT